MVNNNISDCYLQLEVFVQHIKLTARMLPTQIIGIKNTSSKYIYCSESYVKLLGLSADKILDQHDIFNDLETSALRIQEDNEIMQQMVPKAFLHISKVKGNWAPITLIKSPIIDPIINKSIGIICQIFDFAVADPASQILQSCDKLYLSNVNKYVFPKLTKREKQVIFLFLYNMNSEQIIDILYKIDGRRIAKSTVDCLFTDQLFPKFAVYSRKSLYNRLIRMGYNKLIPLEILNKQAFLLDMKTLY